jgi:hypothetical protein
MEQKITILTSVLNLIEGMNTTGDFIGKDEVNMRLRWTASALATQIHADRHTV